MNKVKMSVKLLPLMMVLVLINVSYAIQITRDIPYTYDGQQMLDLFLPVNFGPQETKSRPAAIVMHAGGWISGNRKDLEYIAEWFAGEGFVVINVSYALAPENKWPAQISDVIQGVWWLKQNAVRFNINPNKILAVGASSGGHLAAMLGQMSVNHISAGVNSEVHGIVSFSGPWNLLDATTEEQIYFLNLMLPNDTPEARLLGSPVYQISRHSPPALIFHGTDDALVPFRQSRLACEVYASKGLDHCFLMPLEGHTHSSVVDTEILFTSIRKFLNWWLTQ